MDDHVIAVHHALKNKKKKEKKREKKKKKKKKEEKKGQRKTARDPTKKALREYRLQPSRVEDITRPLGNPIPRTHT